MFGHGVLLSDLFKHPIMEKCYFLAGKAGIEKRIVSRVNVMDAPDVADWMRGEELLLTTGYVLRDNPILIGELIKELDKKNVSGLGVKLGRFIDSLPNQVLIIADELEFPLFCIPENYAFSDMFNPVLNMIIKKQLEIYSIQSSQLKFQDYVSRSFLEIMVSGGDFKAIIQHLKILINKDVVFLNFKNKIFYALNENSDFYFQITNNPLSYYRTTYHSFPINLEEDRYGEIIIDHPRNQSVNENWIWSINYAKIAFLLFIQKGIAIKESRLRYKDTFLQSLFLQQINRQDDFEEMFNFLGERTMPPFVVLVIEIDNVASNKDEENSVESRDKPHLFREALWSEIYDFMKISFGRLHYTTIGERQVSLISLHPDERKRLPQLEEVIIRLKSKVFKERERTISVAVGGVVTEISKIPGSYKQSKACLDFTRSSGINNSFFVWDKLGLIRLLLSASNKGEIRRFVDQYFEKFKPLNVSIVSEYMETLEILTKNGWNQKASAKELHIHYNTLRYRLQKISQICNYDIENPETRVELSVALKLYNINKNMKES